MRNSILAPLALLLAPFVAEPMEGQEPVATRRARPASKPWIATPTQPIDDTTATPVLAGGAPAPTSKPWGAGGDRRREARPTRVVVGPPTYASKPWVAR